MKSFLCALALTFWGMHAVASLAPLSNRTISNEVAGYDQDAYDACMDSFEDVACE